MLTYPSVKKALREFMFPRNLSDDPITTESLVDNFRFLFVREFASALCSSHYIVFGHW